MRFSAAPSSRQVVLARSISWLVVGALIGGADGLVAGLLWPWQAPSWADRLGTLWVSTAAAAGLFAAVSLAAELPARILQRLAGTSAAAWHASIATSSLLMLAVATGLLWITRGAPDAARNAWLCGAALAGVALVVALARLLRDRVTSLPRIRLRHPAILLTAFSLASMWGARAPLGSHASDLNVVLISIDTLRADHLGLYGYARDTTPSIDALGAESVVFEKAYPQANWTLPSHASMLTGLDPLAHGVLSRTGVISERHTTLAERLRANGYWTAAWVGRNQFSYVGAERGFAQGFEVYEHAPHAHQFRGGSLGRLADHAIDTRFRQLVGKGDTQIAAVLRWLSGGLPEPFFVFVHLDDTHSQSLGRPYDAPAPFRDRFCPGALAGYSGCDRGGLCGTRRLNAIRTGQIPAPSAAELRKIACLYDGAIAFTDVQIGRLVDGLRSRGLLDRTVLILTSDHGEALGEHNEMSHWSLYEEVARVPLLIRVPGRVPRRERTVVELVDLVPTILELTGTPGLDKLPGTSLLTGRAAGEGDAAFVVGPPPLLPLLWRRGDFKLIANPRGPKRGPSGSVHELYDVVRDPHELQDLARHSPARRVALARELDRRVQYSGVLRRRLLDGAANPKLELEGAEGERLKGLGYVD